MREDQVDLLVLLNSSIGHLGVHVFGKSSRSGEKDWSLGVLRSQGFLTASQRSVSFPLSSVDCLIEAGVPLLLRDRHRFI